MEQRKADDIFELQSRVETPLATSLSDTKAAAETSRIPPMSVTPPGCLTFIRQKGKKARYQPEKQTRLKNSLLVGVGFLELANAGDFAANVWNEIPVPIYAIVLMSIGAPLALGMIYFAVKDAILSRRNLRGLSAERRYLQAQRPRYEQDEQTARSLDCLLDVNFREMGTEMVDRIGMDICMGFGAFAVGVGTYMAIGGANPDVFEASNLLSGYIGNAPCALYGLCNLLWSAFVWRRARRHNTAGRKEISETQVERMLKIRISNVQFHSALNGITGAVAGAASLITATMWYGYVALAPCIVVSVVANYIWRHRIGYDRLFVGQVVSFDKDALVAELVHIDSCRQRLTKPPTEPLSELLSDPTSTACVVEFITNNKLFEDFCIRVLKDAELSAALVGTPGETVTLTSESLAAIDNAELKGRLLKVAQAFIVEDAPKCFGYQERSVLEMLGCYMCLPAIGEGKA
ncbi:hypothetical protein TOPH_09083 [Tolypocladium ophioglossoides CBS 100239]|uniref:Integral membrane protein n=1 Tax=Tolypocladium ophioglossoides (strain CBS 100239) TaxID=1163406 RepID=A0A0L0MWW4_TOLOC|nr:hypothetical protein TOPH_09083 [Tolypocladium ophioglossoides CBS 100239]